MRSEMRSRTAGPRAIGKIKTTWDKRATSVEMAGQVSRQSELGLGTASALAMHKGLCQVTSEVTPWTQSLQFTEAYSRPARRSGGKDRGGYVKNPKTFPTRPQNAIFTPEIASSQLVARNTTRPPSEWKIGAAGATLQHEAQHLRIHLVAAATTYDDPCFLDDWILLYLRLPGLLALPCVFLLLLVLAAYAGLTTLQLAQYVNDKVLHFATFFALTVVFYWIVDTNRRRTLNMTLVVCTLVLGVGSEFVQSFLPNDRDFDLYDIVANVVGSLAGLGLCSLYHKRMLERRRQHKQYNAVPGEEQDDVELGEGHEAGITDSLDNARASRTLEEEVDNWDENEVDNWDDVETPEAAIPVPVVDKGPDLGDIEGETSKLGDPASPLTDGPPRTKDVTPTNPRGIPYAPFVDKVEDYVTTREDVEPTLRSFQEMISKYQFMELNLQRRMTGLKEKIPDIQKTLDTVQFLKSQREETDPIESTFELNDTLYAKAKIPPTEEVYIWLGANVMLSYPIEEAEALLGSKLSTAKTSLSNCEEDLDFLREQITTMEVAIARVYNWEVVQKRKDKTDEGKDKQIEEKGEGPPNG
ncbi:hypothetical protein G7046_g4059 [Stylonectria norvegica]|nr:hypothetical protein G7046_g4059 [Stylonectria norvegica]